MAIPPNEFTIFYAWQSDTPGNHNRYLIYEALIQAVDEINESGNFAFRVIVDSDTAGMPGLCDIPATILAKIESADAALLDLTFVARTTAETPKSCPNPNVLFELGYAFHAIGPERLICVLNEAHGGVNETLFDIAHRRHPIKYTSPIEGSTRAEVTQALAARFAEPLRMVVGLGIRSLGVDDDREFLRETSEIENHWRSHREANDSWATVTFTLHPKRYQNRRWIDDRSIESLIRAHQIQGQHRTYPPMTRYTDSMPWGIYNGAYGRPFWAFTYAGEFWASYRLDSEFDYPPQGVFHLGQDDNPDCPSKVSAGGWVDFAHRLYDLHELFRFAGSLANAYSAGEIIEWRCRADGISQRHLASCDGTLWYNASRKCAAPYAERSNQLKASEFAADWIEACSDFCHELFGKFDIQGQRIDRSTVRDRLGKLGEAF